MTKTVVIASNNIHKVEEMALELNFGGWQFCTLNQLSIVSDPDETADTFEGNARIKARAAHVASGGLAALADDSGLVVDALGGAPGVYSARFARQGATDDENNAKLLQELSDVPLEKRTARFVSTLVFVEEDGSEKVACGTLEGVIGFEPQGNEGFGYDPLFFPDVFSGMRTLAQITQAEKNTISHRGNALRNLKKMLNK